MLGAVVFALVAAASPDASTAPAPAEVEAAVRAAIVRAVATRVGAQVDVSVDTLRIHGRVAAAGLTATPDAGSRAGGPMRFILRSGARRSGSADAIVRLQGRHARAVRALGAGAIVGVGDVADAIGDPGRVPLQPLPPAATLVGARVRRAVAEGGVVAGDAVTAPPLVRSGDEVSTLVRVGPITAHGRATVLDDGAAGAMVRLQVEKRRLRGRVRAAGEVEVTP